MTITSLEKASDEHHAQLVAALADLQAILERHAARADAAGAVPDVPRERAPVPATLAAVAEAFGLSPFERDVLLLAAGVELDASFAAACARAQGGSGTALATFRLALAALPDAHWSALTPTAPLRRWRLVELLPGETLLARPLRVDERVLHHIAGVPHMDERLGPYVESPRTLPDLFPSHARLAERLADAWAHPEPSRELPVLEVRGADAEANRAVAVAACESAGLGLLIVPVHTLPTGAADVEDLARLLEREAALSRAAVLLERGDDDGADAAAVIPRLAARLHAPLMVSTRDPVRLHRAVSAVDVPRPSTEEARSLWAHALGASANGFVDALVSEFRLDALAVRGAAREALTAVSHHGDADLGDALWDACRARSRPRLDDLAQRITPTAGWDDIVLPAHALATLREIVAQVRQRMRVYEEWGFAGKSARGLGISALFAGDSGTGKTMAAEVLANALRLDLYRIDLSQVVSKYIGETEKNLRRVFDAAEDGGAILLFDEADALFGKRSDVKDSHDRYANIEVSYLLQRMEAYRGLAILTTNKRDALDAAFLRRLRFVIQFPFPDAPERANIWRRVFPADTPTRDLDPVKLSTLPVAGGNIRNIALTAAFLAADEGEPVQMRHVAHAARAEYAKLERHLSDAEIRGWV